MNAATRYHAGAAELAHIIAKVCGDKTIASLINEFLCCEDCPELTDREVNMGKVLFDVLTEVRPDCVEIAQNS